MNAAEKEVKQNLATSRQIVEAAIDRPKGNDTSSWYELINPLNDSWAGYPSPCQDQPVPAGPEADE